MAHFSSPWLLSLRERSPCRLTPPVRPRSPFSFCLLVWSGFGKLFVQLRSIGITDHFSFFGISGIGLSLTHQPSAHGFLPSSGSLQLLGLHFHAITPVVSFGLVGMNVRSRSSRLNSRHTARSGRQCLGLGLTLRSTRTPPALPSALSQLLASSAPLIASVQAWPVSFTRWAALRAAQRVKLTGMRPGAQHRPTYVQLGHGSLFISLASFAARTFAMPVNSAR